MKPTDKCHSGFAILSWRMCAKNTLRAFASIELPSGLILHDCTVHRKNDSEWVGLPGRSYTKPDGSTGWSPVVEFTNKEAKSRFQRAALAAITDAGYE